MKQVYILHGWTYNLDKWTEVCDALRRRGIDSVQLKVPGLTTASTKVWDIAGYEQWLDEQLRGIDQPIVIGHSNGGRIALSYVQHHPSRLSKLILIDSAGLAHNQLWPRTKLVVLRVLSQIGKIFFRIRLIKKIFYTLIGARDYFDAPENMKLTMRNMLQADNEIDLAQIKLPVTIIWGREDKITPLADAHQLRQAIAGSTLHIVEDARHAPFANHPDEVADLIVGAIGNRK